MNDLDGKNRDYLNEKIDEMEFNIQDLTDSIKEYPDTHGAATRLLAKLKKRRDQYIYAELDLGLSSLIKNNKKD